MPPALRKLFCWHIMSLVRRAGNRMFVQCIKCDFQSNGVAFGGHRYSNETLARLARNKEMGKARCKAFTATA